MSQQKMELMKVFQAKLSSTAKKVFEDAAFALIDMPEEIGGTGGAATELYVGMGFEGPFKGRMAMSASEELAPMLAANMLGVDEDDPDAEEKGADALKEILNMLCGNLLPAVAGTDAEFRMQAPENISRERFLEFESRPDDPLSFSENLFVEGYKVRISLVLDSE